jgi:hypothetical protein
MWFTFDQETYINLDYVSKIQFFYRDSKCWIQLKGAGIEFYWDTKDRKEWDKKKSEILKLMDMAHFPTEPQKRRRLMNLVSEE